MLNKNKMMENVDSSKLMLLIESKTADDLSEFLNSKKQLDLSQQIDMSCNSVFHLACKINHFRKLKILAEHVRLIFIK